MYGLLSNTQTNLKSWCVLGLFIFEKNIYLIIQWTCKNLYVKLKFSLSMNKIIIQKILVLR